MTADTLLRIRPLADALLKLIGVTMSTGQLVVHFAEGHVQRVETHVVHRPEGPKSASSASF